MANRIISSDFEKMRLDIAQLADINDKLLKSEVILRYQTEVLEVISRAKPGVEIFSEIVSILEKPAQGMLCSILFVEEGKYLRHCASPSLPKAYSDAIDGEIIGARCGSCGTAAFTKKMVIVEDIATNPLWKDYRDLALLHNLHSCWSSPIIDLEGHVLGTFAMYYHKARLPTEGELNLIATATSLVKIAIERYRADRKLQDSQLQAEIANRAKSQFLANMSHEIRTPISAILGFSSLMKANKVSNDDRNLFIDSIIRNGNHLIELIDDILDLSKIDANRIQINITAFNFRGFLEDVILMLQAKARLKEITLTACYLDEFPPTIATDAKILRQILINIIGNAIKFTPPKGQIEVAVAWQKINARKVAGDLSIYVKDTGVGIPDDQKEKLFHAFTRLNASLNLKFDGTGLGLALSRKFANALGGNVTLVASEPGKGSTFCIHIRPESQLIRHVQTQSTPKRHAGKEPWNAHTLEGCRVLIAEDEPDIQYVMNRYLRSAGATTDIVANGSDAVAKALLSPYDVILMDVKMPGCDGHEATRRLRSEGYTKPIIALTAHALEEQKEKCLASGFDHFLCKPIDAGFLIASIVLHSQCEATFKKESHR